MMKEKTERELAQTNIAENRKAYFDYHLIETFEAGGLRKLVGEAIANAARRGGELSAAND